MSNPVEEFVAQPTEGLLACLTKEQLVQVGEHYGMDISAHLKRTKTPLVHAIRTHLIDSGTLSMASPFPVPSDEVRLREMDVQEKQLEHELALRKLEVEKQQRKFELRRIELELASKGIPIPRSGVSPFSPSEPPLFPPGPAPLDVSKYIRVVPPFSEKDVEKYFSHFERVATSLRWPKEIWTVLIQCVLVGRAQDVYASLSAEQSTSYDDVKTAIPRAYELVPEAYRQRFRNYKKFDKHSYIELAREKEHLFNRWCTSQQVDSMPLL